ncbi:hypothetical protein THAOC_18080 [Thalassiosira oceanica]|uniref:Uncharacterized protein n=1 Tax=Thalassiosira oceanica TaxID=159749 RepID=K0S811_THAOC|nr:hypothetical protein THAOC_18080 [Thalassiosira oceanica]|eukprot:EJK61435.1 hypothetical protein THAOC_18080 [Thalassiosira oceanica]
MKAELLLALTATAAGTICHGFTIPPPTSTRGLTSLSESSSDGSGGEFALLFDCDGVIIETEELHRLAYNAAFKEFDLKIEGGDVEWSVPYYDVLQNTVGGGKNKMFYHFRNTTKAFPTFDGGTAAPANPEEEQELVDRLQARKTDLYKELIAEKATPRPGVLELMDQALADPTVRVGV